MERTQRSHYLASACLVVLGLKFAAYWLTGSAALYSDALESTINVLAAGAAFFAIRVSARPADTNHPYGHHKAEYFSAVFEGGLVVGAALAIFHSAYLGFLAPKPLEAPLVGLAINGGASAINGAWAWVLLVLGPSLAIAGARRGRPACDDRRAHVGRCDYRRRARIGDRLARARSRGDAGRRQRSVVGLRDGSRRRGRTYGDVVGVVVGQLNAVAMMQLGSVPQNVNFAIQAPIVVNFLSAKDVVPKMDSSDPRREMPWSDVADLAKKFTVQVDCEAGTPRTSDTTPAPKSETAPSFEHNHCIGAASERVRTVTRG